MLYIHQASSLFCPQPFLPLPQHTLDHRWLSDKESACTAGGAGEVGSFPGLGRFPGGGNGNPLQYSCWENPLEREAWMATVCGLAESETTEHACTLWNGKVIDNKKEQSTS